MGPILIFQTPTSDPRSDYAQKEKGIDTISVSKLGVGLPNPVDLMKNG